MSLGTAVRHGRRCKISPAIITPISKTVYAIIRYRIPQNSTVRLPPIRDGDCSADPASGDRRQHGCLEPARLGSVERVPRPLAAVPDRADRCALREQYTLPALAVMQAWLLASRNTFAAGSGTAKPSSTL
jgi:hypothetical protein